MIRPQNGITNHVVDNPALYTRHSATKPLGFLLWWRRGIFSPMAEMRGAYHNTFVKVVQLVFETRTQAAPVLANSIPRSVT